MAGRSDCSHLYIVSNLILCCGKIPLDPYFVIPSGFYNDSERDWAFVWINLSECLDARCIFLAGPDNFRVVFIVERRSEKIRMMHSKNADLTIRGAICRFKS